MKADPMLTTFDLVKKHESGRVLVPPWARSDRRLSVPWEYRDLTVVLKDRVAHLLDGGTARSPKG